MASIGKDDLFDEETVRLYLKEVTMDAINHVVSHNADKKDKEKEQEAFNSRLKAHWTSLPQSGTICR